MELSFFIQNLPIPGTLIPAIRKECASRYKYEAFKEYYPKEHKVMKKELRPEKLVFKPDPSGACDEHGNPRLVASLEEVNRIALALQQIIVTRAAAFLTGGKVTYQCNAETDADKRLLRAVNDIFAYNKVQYKNSPIATKMFSETECAEIWYSQKDKDGNVKMKMKIYSPSDGYELMPVFDDIGDLIAFGLGWESMRNDTITSNRTKFIDIYTSDNRYRYVDHGSGWVLLKSKSDAPNPLPLPYGKMPVIYYQSVCVWEIVQTLIDRIEKLLSNFGDTNDYNGSPILAAKGNIIGFASKGEQGKVVEMEEGGDLKYVSWDQAPESIKLEFETLLDMVYTLTQTPDISFKAMKGLGDISGRAFDRIMIDAHLKAISQHNGAYGECIQRRINFIKSACISIDATLSASEGLEITPNFGLFTIDDLADRVDVAQKANGGKPVMSHKESIEYVGYTGDADKLLEEIKAEEAATTTPAN